MFKQFIRKSFLENLKEFPVGGKKLGQNDADIKQRHLEENNQNVCVGLSYSFGKTPPNRGHL